MRFVESTIILQLLWYTERSQNIIKLSNTIRAFSNPFSQDGTDLFNLVTKVVLPEELKDDL